MTSYVEKIFFIKKKPAHMRDAYMGFFQWHPFWQQESYIAADSAQFFWGLKPYFSFNGQLPLGGEHV